jgi:hypothetical protein
MTPQADIVRLPDMPDGMHGTYGFAAFGDIATLLEVVLYYSVQM